MIAILGFLAAALIFSAYAAAAKRSVTTSNKQIKFYSTAYYLLATACLTWIVGVAVNTETALKVFVLVGDGFVLLATVAIGLSAINPKRQRTFGIFGIVLAAAFLAVRASQFTNAPYVQDGVLNFNTPRAIAIGFSVLFVAIWLPVNLGFARQLTARAKMQRFRSAASLSCTLASLSVIIFLSAHKQSTIILSFGIVCAAFASLTSVVYVARKAK